MAARDDGRPSGQAQREFVSEAEEILERMRSDLADLADRRANGGRPPAETVNGLFRSAHSLKGLSGLFGAEGMGELAHHLEDVLDRLRMGRAVLDEVVLAHLDEAIAVLAARLAKLDEPGGDDSAALSDLVRRIESWTRGPQAAPAVTQDVLDLDPAMMRALTEYEEHRLRESLRTGRRIHVVEAIFQLSDFEEGLGRLIGAIREAGEVLATLPSPGDSPDSQIRFSVLVASDLDPRVLAARLEMPEAAVRAASRPPRGRRASDADLETAHEGLAAPVRPGAGSWSAPEAASLKSLSDTVRVDIAKLDELMNLVGELAIVRGQLAALTAELRGLPAAARLAAELDKASRSLDRKLQTLQARVLEVRMVPLRQVFEKLSRVARRLRRDLGRDVRLEIRGATTELDKLIVEQLVDPLMHVVRNAFDHAIEPAAERVAAGKPAEGTIRVEAWQRGNDVVVAVADDGRGIDADAVQRRAVERGILAPDAVLGAKERLQLVFAPGLTTRTEVTRTSGRGVGLDVVRANVTSLGGIVDVDSTPGRGTTLTMTLPITLAIVQVLVVGVGDQRFALPLNAVRETLLVQPAEVQRSEGVELLNLRGEALPLRRLASWFGLDEAPGDVRRFAVVLGGAEARLGLLVDRLEGQQDAVIKPIQGPLQTLPGIAGATELGDASAVLVLDVASLLDEAPPRREAA